MQDSTFRVRYDYVTRYLGYSQFQRNAILAGITELENNYVADIKYETDPYELVTAENIKNNWYLCTNCVTRETATKRFKEVMLPICEYRHSKFYSKELLFSIIDNNTRQYKLMK